MDAREILRNELRGIMTATTSVVKRLRRRGSHVMANRMLDVGMQARRLHDRHDFLLPTYRRRTERLRQMFDQVLAAVNEQYPGLYVADPASPAVVTEQEIVKTVKVSMTLPIAEWDFVDSIIAAGHVDNRAAYFRRLHYERVRR